MAKFRARARTVDMLGRQQIAGIPTAISELFKNAHDAYAREVRADYLRRQHLLVLRDNGIGMTPGEFEARWLVLGTESKLASAGQALPPRDPEQPVRPMLGEKGIGRLAIAAIGRQVLVLTRAVRGSEGHDLVAAFLHWWMFRLPGIDLEDVPVPLRVFHGGTVPTANDIASLVDELRQHLTKLSGKTDDDLLEMIRADLDRFSVNPHALLPRLGGPQLTGDGRGTQFYVQPVDDSLSADIDSAADPDSAPPLLATLIGFTNTMTPRHAPPALKASFYDFKVPGVGEDLIEENSFFTEQEFDSADHHIEGEFDKYGQFTGTIRIFNDAPIQHRVAWPPARGRQTECGPFRINLAVLQGKLRESRVPPEEYAALADKANKIGGLYIYRDGVRVLPYGRNDYDWLDIEKNRTKKASYYYFSYRNIFGVVEINQTANAELSEKAGREGFRENTAYRQFRDILKHFFIQIAADFFREGGRYTSLYDDRRESFRRLKSAREVRDRQVRQRRSELTQSLDHFFLQLKGEVPQRTVDQVLSDLQVDVSAAMQKGNVDSEHLLRAESKARERLAALRSEYRIPAPRGVGLSRALRRDYEHYKDDFAELSARVLIPAEEQVDRVVSDAAAEASVVVDRRRRFDNAIAEASSRARVRLRQLNLEVGRALNKAREVVTAENQAAVTHLENTLSEVASAVASMDLAVMSEKETIEARLQLEETIRSAIEAIESSLQNLAAQLTRTTAQRDAEGRVISTLDVEEATEEELLELREQADAALDAAQVGMAIEVINHEFEATLKTIRSNLKRLQVWTDLNPDLRSVYDGIGGAFDHLSGYLALLTPLHRRLHRTAVSITGTEVYRFLEDLFEDRLLRDTIELRATNEFRAYTFQAFPSTIYPAFINLVDNATFWLRDRPEPRLIELDADASSMIVSDNGPGIDRRDRDSIFERGFTRKPYGRGLGLTISRAALARSGFQLSLIEPGALGGATFRITPPRPT
jgi:signal transduction histidine kinase